MSSSPSPSPHDPHPSSATRMMSGQELPKPSCMMAETISPPSSQPDYGNGARAVSTVDVVLTVDVVDFGQHDAEYGKPSCMMEEELPNTSCMLEEKLSMTDNDVAKGSCMMDNRSDTLPNNDITDHSLPNNDGMITCEDVLPDDAMQDIQGKDCVTRVSSHDDDVIVLRPSCNVDDVVRPSCSVNDGMNNDVIRPSCMQDVTQPIHPYSTPRPPIIRPACAYTIPNIINLNQSSPKPNEDEFQNFKTESLARSHPEGFMYPQPPFFLPPHPVFNPFNPHPTVIRPTVFKPESMPRMFNPRMFYPGYMRYPAYPPFPNMYAHHMFPPRVPHPVISVPSDEEEKEVEVENTDPVETLAAELVKVKKVRPIGKVIRRLKAADQKCSKCDGHFLRGPELFCHIEKVHKKNKDHACKHCVYTVVEPKKRCRTVSKSSSTSTTSADSPPSSQEESSQGLCLSTPVSGTLKVRTGRKARAKKEKAEPDLSLPSPKTLQNSLNKIF